MVTQPLVTGVPSEPEEVARAIGLRYVRSGSEPRISRRRCGRGFTYTHSETGTIPRGHPDRPRLDAMVLPPAWSEVWICPWPDGHLLATGRDTQGRRQYRYHERWSTARRELHDATLVPFASRLPRLRSRVRDLLDDPATSQNDRMHALAARLLDETGVRVGNPDSVTAHGTRGLTTLTEEHVEIDDGRLVLSFPGKGGLERALEVEDARLVESVRDAAENDEEYLFGWSENGSSGQVTGPSLNRFLRASLGPDAHAHQFRSWICTWRTLAGLRDATPKGSVSTLLEVLEPIATDLGHTCNTARSHYLHHLVEPAWMADRLPRPHPVRTAGLSLEERRAVAVLNRLQAT